jgi:hypothetical protein
MIGFVSGLLRGVPAALWVVAAVIAYGAWQHHRASTAARKLLTIEAEIAREREAAMARSMAAAQKRLDAQGKVARDAQSEAAAARSDAAAAGAAAHGLREQAAALAASAAAAAGSSASCEAAATTARVLADLLGRADEAAGRMAEVADQRGVSGKACERIYDESLKGAQ